jgi:hypothetical protein
MRNVFDDKRKRGRKGEMRASNKIRKCRIRSEKNPGRTQHHDVLYEKEQKETKITYDVTGIF